MTVLEVVKEPASILRQVATEVSPDEVGSHEIKTLIADMLETMTANKGVGIAAPQVGVSKRVMIIASLAHPAYPGSMATPPLMLINPTLDDSSAFTSEGYEGCLSIPGKRGLVRRNDAIYCSFCNSSGVQSHALLEGLLARVFQHELDHLNGVLFADIPGVRTITEDEYQVRLKAFQDTGKWPA